MTNWDIGSTQNGSLLKVVSVLFERERGKDSPAQRKFALNLHWNFFTIYDVRDRKL